MKRFLIFLFVIMFSSILSVAETTAEMQRKAAQYLKNVGKNVTETDSEVKWRDKAIGYSLKLMPIEEGMHLLILNSNIVSEIGSKKLKNNDMLARTADIVQDRMPLAKVSISGVMAGDRALDTPGLSYYDIAFFHFEGNIDNIFETSGELIKILKICLPILEETSKVCLQALTTSEWDD